MAFPQAIPVSRLIRVVRFEFCPTLDCKILSSPHLLMSTDTVPLNQGNAIAISYTWGEFDRQNVTIGHGANGDHISLCLGSEWILSDLISKLFAMGHELSPGDSSYMPFWIDQLCIRQESDDELRAALASIPHIYNTLDVVALMPGSPCKCLREGLDEFGGCSARTPQEEIDRQSIAWTRKIESCLNSTSFCSYFDRLWTRQEMMYARNIHVEWTNSEEAQCVKYASWGKSNLFLSVWKPGTEEKTGSLHEFEEMAKNYNHQLMPFAFKIFEHALSQGLTYVHALAQVVLNRDKSWHNAIMAFEDYLAQDGPLMFGRYPAIQQLSKFLAGEKLEKDRKIAEDTATDEIDQLKRFLSRLSRFGRMRRSATKQRDYVLAVWVDCPKYVLPLDLKSLSLSFLLEDAILQLEKNYNIGIPVTAIAGLFGSLEASALWRPSSYLGNVQISHARQVYGTVLPECLPLQIQENDGLYINLHSQDFGRPNAKDFREFFPSGNPGAVIEYMQEIVNRWPSIIIERIIGTNPTFSHTHEEHLSAAWRNLILMGHRAVKDSISAEAAQHQEMQDLFSRFSLDMIPADTDLHDTVYELVCDALGLDFPSCLKNPDLHIAIYPSNHPAIGLFNRGRDELEFPLQDMDSLDRVTLCRDVGGQGAGCTLLVAVRVQSLVTRESKCYAIGIWVPQEITPNTDVKGFLDDEYFNATLV